ncbi:MAG: methylated-DNA--[protein]-cysteine S-methyltransferase [Defluviitaleaceae bacterium]|nr:methylated-DNA--[protein]-cysteine S-methyltransferase [Defluviitaleaceae bacterium]
MTLEYTSPIGKLLITAHDGKIIGVNFTMDGAPTPPIAPKTNGNTAVSDNTAVLNQCAKELADYFAGTLKEFTVPISPSGTPFRMRVWEALQTIPYGQTISYKQLAERVGQPAASRAVGGANHHNPINIIIPCHRVIGAGGKLTGYGGGLDNKKFLLELENPFVIKD